MFGFLNDISIMTAFFLVIISLWFILKSADYFVKGASSVALKSGMSIFVVGLTIVAMGTSAPELFINVIAASHGATDLSIGNIIGSNIAGILLGLGISALFLPLLLKSETIWREIPYALLGAVMLIIFGLDKILDGALENVISRSEGITFLAFFVIFIVYTFNLNRKNNDQENSEEDIEEYSWLKSILYILGGILGLVLAGDLTVKSAVIIAEQIGLSQNLIGLTVVAAGTSLPEIATAIIAARKGYVDMVVGGIVGTIIFNIFFALGLTAVITPLPFRADNVLDAIVLLFVTFMLFISMFFGEKYVLEKKQGILFILIYIFYILFVVLREIF